MFRQRHDLDMGEAHLDHVVGELRRQLRDKSADGPHPPALRFQEPRWTS